MKKLLGCVLAAVMTVSLNACGGKADDGSSAGFHPDLDKNTSCGITVAGSYDNFEALETEFERFNEVYPNVRLSYVKLDDTERKRPAQHILLLFLDDGE